MPMRFNSFSIPQRLKYCFLRNTFGHSFSNRKITRTMSSWEIGKTSDPEYFSNFDGTPKKAVSYNYMFIFLLKLSEQFWCLVL